MKQPHTKRNISFTTNEDKKDNEKVKARLFSQLTKDQMLFLSFHRAIEGNELCNYFFLGQSY